MPTFRILLEHVLSKGGEGGGRGRGKKKVVFSGFVDVPGPFRLTTWRGGEEKGEKGGGKKRRDRSDHMRWWLAAIALEGGGGGKKRRSTRFLFAALTGLGPGEKGGLRAENGVSVVPCRAKGEEKRKSFPCSSPSDSSHSVESVE